jgi:hypothetical protein
MTKTRTSRTLRAKLENLALTWVALAIGPGLVVAFSWFGLG